MFYWGDVVGDAAAAAALRALRARVPGAARQLGAQRRAARTLLPLLYLPALLLGGANVATIMRGDRRGEVLTSVVTLVERGELLYLALCLVAGLVIMIRALGRVRSVTARRQLRWIVWGTALGALPFVFGYALPFALGFDAGAAVRADRGAARPRAAGVRLGDRPLPPDGRRGHHQARARLRGRAGGDRRDLYDRPQASPATGSSTGPNDTNPVIALLATMVVVLLARPVKNAIQTGLDRVYYRDRYDYRRALVGFARDLNSDLDLFRLSERLVRRVTETLVVDRMALMLAPVAAGRDAQFVTIAHAGFGGEPPVLAAASEVAHAARSPATR